jgi:pectinesterase inhibitor-like protein
MGTTTRPRIISLDLALAAAVLSASVVAGAASLIDGACSATPHPELCKATLLSCPDGRDAATPRALAEAAIRAASNVGAAAGGYARAQLDFAGDDTATWQCLDECADDIEEAVSHLDDTEGEIDDAAFNDVKLFLDAAARDSWSCDESCRHAPPTPVKAALLAKNREFEDVMNVTNALIKQATGGAPPPRSSAP